MLIHRIITSLILFSLILVIFFFATDPILIASMILFCTIAVYELTNMYQFNILSKLLVITIFLILTTTLCVMHYQFASIIIRFVSMFLWYFTVPIILIAHPQHFSKVIITIITIIMFTSATYILVTLHQTIGALELLSIMMVAWLSDVSAYFVGKKFGKHQLAPAISPNKTLEGAFASLISVTIYFILLKYFAIIHYLPNYFVLIKFSIVLVSAGIMGDLLESWLKRVASVKDSSNILPGHGGVFDRIDSMVAILAVAFILLH